MRQQHVQRPTMDLRGSRKITSTYRSLVAVQCATGTLERFWQRLDHHLDTWKLSHSRHPLSSPPPRSMHEKNGALDQTIHWLLGQTIFAAAAFTALEAAFPEAFLLTAGRVFAQMLQGTWFCQAASVLFGGGCGAAGGARLWEG